MRAAALAMETSGDIEEATGVMFQELQGLSLPFYRGGVGIAEEEDPQVVELWGQDSKGAVSRGMQVNLYEHPVMARIGEAWQRGEDVYVAEAEGDELEDWKRYVEKLGYPLEWPEDLEVYRNHCAYFRYGILYAVVVERLDDDDLNVIRRFRDAFAFAYNRYLELAEKERQNRELAVEGALERVRGKALAMESFDDLRGVSETIFSELAELEFEPKRSAINVGQSQFIAAESRGGEARHILLPDMDDSNRQASRDYVAERMGPGHLGEWERVAQAREQGASYCQWTLEGDELEVRKEAIAILYGRDLSEAGSVGPDEVEVHYRLFFEGGLLSINTAGKELSEEEIEVGLRFTRLFEFAYDRYQELDAKQKANRELSVEAALERVRGKALAMETKEDLSDISVSLFDELVRLDLRIKRLGITFTDAAVTDNWMVNYRREHRRVQRSDEDFREEGRAVRAEQRAMVDEARREGRPYAHFHLTAEESEERAIVNRPLDMTEEEQRERWEQRGQPGSEDHYRIVMEKGWVSLVSEAAYSEEQIEVAHRFAGLFEFAYDRFLDLEAKQRRAREAEVEASLERVRARALGMQESVDIGEVAKLLFEEMLTLGFDPVRSAITVNKMDGPVGPNARFISTKTWWGRREMSFRAGHVHWSDGIVGGRGSGSDGGLWGTEPPNVTETYEAWQRGDETTYLIFRTREQVVEREGHRWEGNPDADTYYDLYKEASGTTSSSSSTDGCHRS